MRPGPRYWLLLLTGLLAACATSSPVGPDALEAPPEVVDSWEEGCGDPRTLVLLCQEDSDECGLFVCREVVPGPVVLASRGGGFSGPNSQGPFRRWRRGARWPGESAPVFTFRFNRHLEPKPLVPQLPQLPSGRYVRHHIFPQASDLARWFTRQGVPDIHQFTMVIPEHIHREIHSGGPRGGVWNQAWRQFRDVNSTASPAEIYRHAGELIFRFELTGPLVPYRSGRR